VTSTVLMPFQLNFSTSRQNPRIRFVQFSLFTSNLLNRNMLFLSGETVPILIQTICKVPSHRIKVKFHRNPYASVAFCNLISCSLEWTTYVNLCKEFKGMMLDISSYLTILTLLLYSRRDIFVRVKSVWFPVLWYAAAGSKDAIWTVSDD